MTQTFKLLVVLIVLLISIGHTYWQVGYIVAALLLLSINWGYYNEHRNKHPE